MFGDKAHDFSLLIEVARAQADGQIEDAVQLLKMVSKPHKPLGEELLAGTSQAPSVAAKLIRTIAGVQGSLSDR